MLPIGDDDSDRRTVPLVTYALIALNVLFFFVELSGGDAFIGKWAFVPRRFLANPSGDFLTLFTSHVHACRMASSGRQHALPMDLRRQCGRPFRAFQVHDLLPALRACCNVRTIGF